MIRFSRYTKLYALISFLVIGAGLFSILRFGYKVSIDFAGGTVVEYKVETSEKTIAKAAIQKALESVGASYIEHRVSAGILEIRANNFEATKQKTLTTTLSQGLASDLTLLRLTTVGPTVGRESVVKMIVAIVLGSFVILGYIFYAFKRMTFAVAAIVALIHDLLVVLGIYSIMGVLLGATLDTLFATAILTTMTFSTHDTIVIFDKIREDRKHGGNTPLHELADKAVSQTMVRSLNNSLTIFFMLLALVLLGGDSVRFFAMTLLIGTITGVYSSPFVATPVAVWLEKLRERRG